MGIHQWGERMTDTTDSESVFSSPDYQKRTYLSAVEAARYLGTTVKVLHRLIRTGQIEAEKSASGQFRFSRSQLDTLKDKIHFQGNSEPLIPIEIKRENTININNTVQRIFIGDARDMSDLPDSSVHLMVTSPPYFDAKLYAREEIEGDLGDIHELNVWFNEIEKVWREVYRVLQPGRKAFINIMNLPIRENGSYRTLNLVGKTIDLCERIGFIFKRDIVWHKTNGVRAHFGTYPYPGGILINNMHEFILEFNKPEKKGFRKYAHLSEEQREKSKLDKEFWLSIKNSDVWIMKPVPSGDNRSHVSPFPPELPLRIIRAFSFVGETVLDPFLGSGTTLQVCAKTGRNGVGYEINPDIARTALQGLATFQKRLF